MRSARTLLTLASLALVANTASAQVGTTSNIGTVQLNAIQLPVLTVTVNTPSTNIASIGTGQTNFATPVSITTAWNLTGGATVRLIGYFAVPAQAMANGTNYIPSSAVEGKIGAAPYASFTGAAVGGAGVANGSLQLFSQALAAPFQGTRTDNVDLRLNLATTPAAGTYTGTLNLRAVVQ